jgi:hypothetical protein
MKRLNKVILLSLIGFTRLNGFRLIPVLLGSMLLSLHLHAGEATASDALRKIISLDQGWRFQEGWFTLPERTQVSAWRYRLDARGEASADVMAATGLDTSGPEWGGGPKFDARKGQKEESILQGWLAVGDMNRKDDFVSVWFRAELPGGGGHQADSGIFPHQPYRACLCERSQAGEEGGTGGRFHSRSM